MFKVTANASYCQGGLTNPSTPTQKGIPLTRGMIRRAYPVSFSFLTARKRRLVAEICRSFRAAVNHYIRILWLGELASYKDALPPTRLSSGFLDDAIHQARDLVSSARKSAVKLETTAGRPFFRGKPILGANVVSVEQGAGSFDLVLRLSTFEKGQKIILPTKATKPMRDRLLLDGAYLVQGAALDPDETILWVASPPATAKTTGQVIGVDIGVNVLLADSSSGLHGEGLKSILDKIRRRKPGSKGRRRAYAERDDYIHRTVKQLPWAAIRVLVHEDLKRIKNGKRKDKRLRKLLGPWNQGKVHELLAARAQDEGAAEATVEARGNSTTCPVCGSRGRSQRKGAVFKCRNTDCRFTAHADTVGATNALKKASGAGGPAEVALEQQTKDAAWRRPILIQKAAKAAALSLKIQLRGKERALAVKAKSKLAGSRTATRGRRSALVTLKTPLVPCTDGASVARAPAPGNVAGEIARSVITEGGRLVSAAKSPVAASSDVKKTRSGHLGDGHEYGDRGVSGES